MGRRAAALVIAIVLSAAAESCRSVFTDVLGATFVRTDLVMAWLLRPEGPAVTFTSPAHGAEGVAINQSVIVCFSEPVVIAGDADPFRVEMLGDDGETVEEAVPTASVLAGAGPGTEASDTIQILPPEYRYEQNRRYRVVMAEDIFTAHGDMVDPRGRFPLEFTTGDDGDEEPPRVASTAPLDYQSAGHERPVITVQFDDDVVPATGKLSIYRYDHAEQEAAAEPEQIEYKAAYAGNPGSIAFMIQDNLEKYCIYQAVVSGVRDTSGNLMEGNGTGGGAAPDRYAWRFFTGPVVVAVEPASNHRYGFGTFGNPGEQINGEVAGYELLDRNAAIIHGRVGEGGPLSTFFDTTNGSGFPDDVSAIRILHDGRNLAGGLGLIPVCRTITGPNMAPPPKGVFYVDPRWGRFMLPRPAYWSKMESYENATTGAECRGQAEPGFRQEYCVRKGNYSWDDDTLEWLSEDEYGFGSVGGLPAGGKFGNCFTMFWESDTHEQYIAKNTSIDSNYILRPFSNIPQYNGHEGTLSFWGCLDTFVDTSKKWGRESSGQSMVEWRIILLSSLIITIYKEQLKENIITDYIIQINGIKVGELSGKWVHVYINWKQDDTDQKKIFIRICLKDADNEGNCVIIEKSVDYSSDTIPFFEIYGHTQADFEREDYYTRAIGRAWSRIDNIKWYTHDAGDDPSWEYNNGNGCEEALHPVYGNETDCAPKLNDTGGVGYFFIPYNKQY